MTKAKMIQAILNKVSEVNCNIVKVYGVPFGVGYDLSVNVTFKDGKDWSIKAHATNKSWDCMGWLRENQRPFKVYTGSNDYYREDVINHWEKEKGLKYYLERFKKQDLETYYNYYVKG